MAKGMTIEKVEFTNSPPRICDIPEFEMKMFAYNLMRATKKWKFAHLNKERNIEDENKESKA